MSAAPFKLLLAIAILSPVSSLNADTVFSSMPASSASDTHTTLYAPTSPGMAYAAAFIATQSFRVQSVVLPGAFQQASPASTFNVSIFSDSQGLPGSALATMSNLGVSSSQVVKFSAAAVSLTSGQTYWLVVTPNSAGSALALATGAMSSPLASTTDVSGASGWTAQGQMPLAFAVNAAAITEIPEPSTVLFVGLAIAAGIGFSRRSSLR